MKYRVSGRNLPIRCSEPEIRWVTDKSSLNCECQPITKVDDMNLRNKVAIISTSVITVSALLVASPALAHKNPNKGSVKATSSSVVATPTGAPTGTPTASPKAPKLGDKHGHGKGHEGKGKDHKKGPKFITQTVTVDVPETGTYQLVVTEVKPVKASPAPTATAAPVPTYSPAPTASPAPVAPPVRGGHSFTVAVTGTGSQTITLNLPHPGEYTVSLVSVVSTQNVTAAK